MGLSYGSLIGTATFLAACGSQPQVDGRPEQVESAARAQHAVQWQPTAALVTQHVDWHSKPCSVAGQSLNGQVGIGRRCTKRGEDFLSWHRSYIQRLRTDFEAQGLSHDIKPWYAVPPEIKAHPNWSASVEAANNAMKTMVNPNTGVRFASFDEFGSFIEGSFHGVLHTISSSLWGVTDPDVGNFMSPRSTLFFKIHGYIDWLAERFSKGDFNWDGKSDLVVRGTNTAAILLMNDGVQTSRVAMPAAGAGECGFTIGATMDYDYTGSPDIIWQGRSCNRVVAWTMWGTQPSMVTVGLARTTELPSQNLPMLGSGDFDADRRPDLAYQTATDDVLVALLKGVTPRGTLTLDIPAGHRPQLIADVNDDGTPDVIVLQTGSNPKVYKVQYVLPGGALGQLATLGGVNTNTFEVPSAVGRYHLNGGSADIAVAQFPGAAGGPITPWSYPLTGVLAGVPSYGPRVSSAVAMEQGENIRGPR